MGSLLIDGSLHNIAGLTIVSKVDQKVFKTYKMRSKPKEIVFHESVSPTLSQTETVLKRKSLGVHLAIDYDGVVYQYCDLGKEFSIHGGFHSYRSVGIEVINSYYAERLPANSSKEVLYNQGWVHKKDYVIPTKAQLEASYLLTKYLTSTPSLHIPPVWPGHKEGRLFMSRLAEASYTKDKSTHREGIFAHNYWKHADGSFPVAYAFIRMKSDFDSDKTYSELIARCNNISKRNLSIDVSDISVGQQKSNKTAKLSKRQAPNIIFTFD